MESTRRLLLPLFPDRIGILALVCGGRKLTGVLEEKPSKQRQEPTTNWTYIWHRGSGNQTPATLVGGECFQHHPITAPQKTCVLRSPSAWGNDRISVSLLQMHHVAHLSAYFRITCLSSNTVKRKRGSECKKSSSPGTDNCTTWCI